MDDEHFDAEMDDEHPLQAYYAGHHSSGWAGWRHRTRNVPTNIRAIDCSEVDRLESELRKAIARVERQEGNLLVVENELVRLVSQQERLRSNIRVNESQRDEIKTGIIRLQAAVQSVRQELEDAKRREEVRKQKQREAQAVAEAQRREKEEGAKGKEKEKDEDEDHNTKWKAFQSFLGTLQQHQKQLIANNLPNAAARNSIVKALGGDPSKGHWTFDFKHDALVWVDHPNTNTTETQEAHKLPEKQLQTHEANLTQMLNAQKELLAASDQPECPVCLEPYTNRGENANVSVDIIAPRCGHVLCGPCRTRIAARNMNRFKCPRCNQEFDDASFTKIFM